MPAIAMTPQVAASEISYWPTLKNSFHGALCLTRSETTRRAGLEQDGGPQAPQVEDRQDERRGGDRALRVERPAVRTGAQLAEQDERRR